MKNFSVDFADNKCSCVIIIYFYYMCANGDDQAFN